MTLARGTDTTQPIVHKPGCAKPDVRNHCACGTNRSCSTCGWGQGSMPCACSRKRTLGALLAADDEQFGPVAEGVLKDVRERWGGTS